ncbi:hypothetical protein ACWDU1_28075, partial [Nocardia sp. NPDC003345]
MVASRNPGSARTDRPADPGAGDALLRLGKYFQRGEVSADQRTVHKVGGRDGDEFYRDRWSHDKVVRSTHGVNCTGSCSWKTIRGVLRGPERAESVQLLSHG